MNSHEVMFSEYEMAAGFPKRRRRLSVVETQLLSEVFTYNQKPNAQVRKDLGQKLNMTPRAVQIWFQNKRAKVKKGISSPLMDDYDQGNLFTPSKTNQVEGFPLPTPPDSICFHEPVFGAALRTENVPEISPFWNGNSNDGTMPTAPLSFVGTRSEIIRKRPIFLDFFNNPAESQNERFLSPIKSKTLEEQFYAKTGKEDSLLVKFLDPISTGPRMVTPDPITGCSHIDSYTIFRESPDRNLFHQ